MRRRWVRMRVIAAGVAVVSAVGVTCWAVAAPWLRDGRLSAAAGAGNYALAESLLRDGAHANAFVSSFAGPAPPLHAAAAGGHADVATLLLAWGADVSADSLAFGTPLHRAAERGDLATVLLLLQHGAAVNARECDTDCTPLCYAVNGGHGAVAQALAEHGGVAPAACFCRSGGRPVPALGAAEPTAESRGPGGPSGGG